ncbi:hypothetical protein D3C81_2088180 [compost metagenome]
MVLVMTFKSKISGVKVDPKVFPDPYRCTGGCGMKIVVRFVATNRDEISPTVIYTKFEAIERT